MLGEHGIFLYVQSFGCLFTCDTFFSFNEASDARELINYVAPHFACTTGDACLHRSFVKPCRLGQVGLGRHGCVQEESLRIE